MPIQQGATPRGTNTNTGSGSATSTRTGYVRVRDVVRHRTYRVPSHVAMLRVPYDLFTPVGSIVYADGLITYSQAGETRTGRVVQSALHDAHPGERVLLQVPDSPPHEWWLCDIESVDGVDVD